MTQQVPPLPSKPLKVFLIVGIVLLIVGLFFFYLASSIGYDYVTTYNNEANLAYPSSSSEYPQFGTYEYYVANVTMQPSEVLTVSYPGNIQINGKLQIVLVEQEPLNNNVLAVSGYPESYRFVSYQNEGPPVTAPFGESGVIVVKVYLIAQNIQDVTLSTVTSLNHYEIPQWVYLGVGIVFSSLAVFVIRTYYVKEEKSKAIRKIYIEG